MTPATIYYDTDAPGTITGRVAVVGYGSQGRAQALNLLDSGADVVVGLRKDSPSWERAAADGAPVAPIGTACSDAALVALLLPDQHQPQVYSEDVEPYLEPGAAVLFAHGFNVHFGQIDPASQHDVVMVAPKAPGPLVRTEFVAGRGVPALVAVARDSSGTALARALSYARAIGCTRAGAIATTFAEETETDLFGEQAVLCGGLSRLIQTGFATLVDAGYQPEVAYFECMHEMKLIVDLLYEGGFSRMRAAISDTAEFGDYTRGHHVVGGEVSHAMKSVLADIRSGAFAREWILEGRAGAPVLTAARRAAARHPIEEVGERLRGLMGWITS